MTMLIVAVCLGFALPARAQQDAPRLGYVYPAGGRQGTTVAVLIGGQRLNGATNVFISGTGVRIVALEQAPALTPKEANELRETLRQLRDRRQAARRGSSKTGTNAPPRAAWTAADEALLVAIRKKLAVFARGRANPALAETVSVQISVDANAALGQRELRLRTGRGLSNPLVFCVGQLPEFQKPPPPEDEEPRFRAEPPGAVPPTETAITLPATVNGQILAGGVDRYRFAARRGQRLVVTVSARQLIPYLADAVPGWCQATLRLSDAQGHELDYADHYRFQPDPVLECVIPKDGEYVVEIHDSLYRGREDFVYRITLGELPFITGVFPLGARAGTAATVTLRGVNLPVTRLTIDARGKLPGIYPLFVRAGEWVSNLMPFAVDDLPECVEREPNDTPATAQRVRLPIIVNGGIARPGDADVFWFNGQAGATIVAEVRARRLNSPLDSVLALTDASGQQLAFNDDHEDKGDGLNTHHADSYLRVTLPTTATYYLQLSDAQHHGGPDYSYRLRISAPRPDFELRAVPASLSARAGGTVPFTVYALRRDGFTNAIAITWSAAPAGFHLSGRVPAGQDQAKLTLTVPPTPQVEPVAVNLEGRATLAGREVVHAVVPAEDMMQAFAYHHLVPVQELTVVVLERFRPRPPAKKIAQP